MPRETFQITVEILNRKNENEAIATAAAYLAYADQTDTIGYSPSFTGARSLSDSSGPFAVILTMELNISNDNHLKEFMDEMAHLSRVKSVERGE